MALAWTMDKAGPMTRSAEDAALVFDAIQGPDGVDRAVKNVPFNWNATLQLAKIRVAYFEPQGRGGAPGVLNENMKTVIAALESQGVKLRAIPMPPAMSNVSSGIILNAECSAAFQGDTLNGKIRELETPRDFLDHNNRYSTWGGTFRAGQFIPAVEYINAMRARTALMQQWWDLFKDVDVIVTNAEPLGVTNLTGTPCVAAPTALVVPAAPQQGGGRGAPADTTTRPAAAPRPARPGNIRFLGALYRDDLVLRVAHAFQMATGFHKARPPLFP